MLELLCRAVAQLYHDDPTVPSVVSAWIPSKEHYYVSVVRYREAFAKDRHVVAKDTGATIEEAVMKLLQAFSVEVPASVS